MAEKYEVVYELYGAKLPPPIIVYSLQGAENIASTIRKMEKSSTYVTIYALYRGHDSTVNNPVERIAIRHWRRDFPLGILHGKGEWTNRWREIPMLGGTEVGERLHKKLIEQR